MKSLPLFYDTQKYYFCHAGVNHEHSLQDQSEIDLLWIRTRFLDYKYSFDKIIVHGHTPHKSGEPEILFNRINCDSHCYKTGVLTCIRINDIDDSVENINSKD